MIEKALRYVGYRLIDLSELKATTQYPNLKGDRDIEWSFIAAHLNDGSGHALDFGNGGSSLGLIAAMKKYTVTAIDINTIDWPYIHPSLKFIQGDIFEDLFPGRQFTVIINCSTTEHVGLSGRYGVVKNNPDGDLCVMRCMQTLLTDGGRMLLTIPVGKDAVFMPLHRVYGTGRLPNLLKGYLIEHEEYWIKDTENKWCLVDRQTALSQEPKPYLYGLGCFVLRRQQ